ncbi:MAG: ATP-binding cassette domain-containing protein [Firmicutes bacterium]|nr:ATP-binding cassette domain-containing protein [Bacillota bacterium]MBQ6663755.1 ATP-binding cassette domain-containing protein [Bacillota bacterium]MCR4710676.1 ATP-binding cassette domain-containing protein [Clostridia bacterium]
MPDKDGGRDFFSADNEYVRSNDYYVRADELTMHFPAAKDGFGRVTSWIHGADRVSFEVPRGKTMGVVGESGCGKSTVGKMLVGLYKPTSGKIFYDGRDITDLSPKERLPYQRRIQMVWQDPYSSLDPRMRVGEIIGESIRNFHLASSRAEYEERVAYLMQTCGLFPEEKDQYAHQFSGGQRQRICIARALAANPDFIVLDEAVSALDVSIQAQIINLLQKLQDEFSLTYLFISHDLNIVRYISDEVIVMYLGQIVERGTMELIFRNRAHPYTRALFSATPVFPPDAAARKERIILQGDVLSPVDPPSGCRFASRCPFAQEKCRTEEPVWHEVEQNHYVKCCLFD